jgi:hypothetical protein
MPLHDPGKASFTASHGAIRLGRSLALPESRKGVWEKWNKILVRQLREAQQPDGSIRGRFNPVISTSLSLLSLAVNYRFLPIYER